VLLQFLRAGQLVDIIRSPDFVGFLWLDDCEDEVCSDEHVVGIRGSLSTLICSVGLEEAPVLLADYNVVDFFVV